MSMYDDSQLSGRFAALAPEPLSGNWDEVLDRAGMARNGRQRFERSRAVPGRRRRLVVVLAALAVAAAVSDRRIGDRARGRPSRELHRPASGGRYAERAGERRARHPVPGSTSQGLRHVWRWVTPTGG